MRAWLAQAGSVRWRMLSTAAGLALALSGCGSDGGSGGSGPGALLPTPSPTPSPAPAPSPTPDPSPTPTPTPSPGLSGWTLNAQAMFDVQPDLATCRTGTLKASVRAEMVNRINALRALHNLPAITHSDADNQQVDESSLMMAVNQTLSHTPPTSWTCYTAAGASGANTGNLIGGWGSGLAWMSEDDNLALWMNEGGTAAIGHRRWILDPFLGKIAYGRVAQASANGLRSDASTLKVHSFASAPATPTGLPALVAYPYGDYPGRYFRARDHLSFSVIASGTSRAANLNVRFTGATITVSDGTSNLPITDVASDNQGYGLPNSIQWRVTGLTSNVTYTVRISGVTGAPQSSYQYTFKMLP